MNTYLTEAQRLSVARHLTQGFINHGMSESCVKVSRGNDFRLIQLDGSTKRALGAKR